MMSESSPYAEDPLMMMMSCISLTDVELGNSFINSRFRDYGLNGKESLRDGAGYRQMAHGSHKLCHLNKRLSPHDLHMNTRRMDELG
jgi:hypothetical protein